MTELTLEEMKQLSEDSLEDEDKLPWCNEGKTKAQAKQDCPLGGCWKYRCRSSKLNAEWHEQREEHLNKRALELQTGVKLD